MMNEAWKFVVGWEGYVVSDQGRVVSLRNVEPVELRGAPGKNGYPRVSLRNGTTTKYRNIHNLVLEAFEGPCPTGQEVRHLNGVRTDARLSNLKYGTNIDNMLDRKRHGTFTQGERSGQAKLGPEEVHEIVRLLELGVRQSDIAKKFGVGQMTVSNIKTGKTWRHITGR